MKLIIDIPEETYRRIQALVNVDYFEHDICGYSMHRIANGTPYEERPHGKWIEEAVPVGLIGRGNRQRRCSICGHRDIQAKTQDVPYCWFCGADMREKDNDTRETER